MAEARPRRRPTRPPPRAWRRSSSAWTPARPGCARRSSSSARAAAWSSSAPPSSRRSARGSRSCASRSSSRGWSSSRRARVGGHEAPEPGSGPRRAGGRRAVGAGDRCGRPSHHRVAPGRHRAAAPRHDAYGRTGHRVAGGAPLGVPVGRHAADHVSLHRGEGAASDQGLGGVRRRPTQHAVVHGRGADEHGRHRGTHDRGAHGRPLPRGGLRRLGTVREHVPGHLRRVRRHGRDVVGGFADSSVVTIIAIPAIAVCE